MTTTTKTATVTETDIEKYLAAKEEVSFKYNKAGAKIWYHARAIIGTGAIDNGKFAGWSVDHDVKINRYEAALYLEKYGLTVEQFVAAEKEFYATRYPKDEATAEDNVEAIAETDGSEEDDDEIFSANVMPAVDDDTDDELIDEPTLYWEERAAEQSNAISDFFYAHKLEVGKHFKVCFEITTADGREHFFMRTFDTFAEAKALVDEFTSTFSEPTLIVIKQNKQNGDWYYSRDVGYRNEKFFDVFKDFGSCMELRCTRSAMERKKN